MNIKIAKIILPAVLSIGTLGAAALTATAGATTTTAATHTTHAKVAKGSVTLSGAVVKSEAAKKVFWIKDGAKTYRVIYTATTKFTKGSTKSFVKGAKVTVIGSFVGKSTLVIKATSITA